MNTFSGRPAVLTCVLSIAALSACGPSGSADTSATAAASSAASASSTSPSAPASTDDSATTTDSASSTSTGSTTTTAPTEPTSSAAAPAPEPKGTMLPLATVPPKAVGSYTGTELTTTGLGKGEKVQWEYADQAAGRDMSLVATTVPYATMVKNFEGTGTPLGSIGECGYLYKSKSTPVCMIRLEGGANMSINGDYAATLEQTRAFTSAFLAQVPTR